MRRRRTTTAILIILLPGALLAPAWFLGGLGASEDDILYYYPSRVFFHETIAEGHWPWLNPWNGCDRPFAADPQTALWYPFTWLFAVLPPWLAYAISLWAHYSLACWGTYRLLRGMRLSYRAALLGGIAFAFSGFMLAHRAHFTMQAAAAWTPWVFWRFERLFSGPPRTARTGPWRFVAAVGVAAMQCFAGHVQIAALTALGTFVYCLARPRQPKAAARLSGSSAPACLWRWLTVWIGVAGLFAIQWLPTAEYVRLCTRTDRTYWQFTENSWYPQSAVGWLLPMFLGQRTPNFFDQAYWGPSHQCEQFAYPGLTPLLLMLLGLRMGWRFDARRRPWLILLLFSLLVALGKFGPICPLLYLIPGGSLFRVPARALVLFNLAVAVLAAVTLNDLGPVLSPYRARLRTIALKWTSRPALTGLLLIAIPVGIAALTLPFLDASDRRAALTALHPWNAAIVVPLGVALLTFAAMSVIVRKWQQPRWLWAAVAMTALDLGVIGWSIDVPPWSTRWSDLVPTPDATWLEPLRASDERLWVVADTAGIYHEPARKLAANTNALVHVRALTDYGPLQPTAYYRQFEFTPWGTTYHTDELVEHTRRLARFNVGWLLLCEPGLPDPPDCVPVDGAPGGWRLCRHLNADGMAFFEDRAHPGAVRYEERRPTSFVTYVDTWPVEAASQPDPRSARPEPRIVVSRLALPGWRATVRGENRPVETAYDALLAIRVPPGHAVAIEWNYSPPGLPAGALISILSVAALAAFLCRRPAQPKRAAAPAVG